MAPQEQEARMAISTQTTYDVDIADVEYLRHGDQPLLARLFKPRGSGPFPIMVELHGGAWVRGDRLSGNASNRWHHIRPRWPTSTMGSAGVRPRLRRGTVARTGSGPWAPPVARIRPCC